MIQTYNDMSRQIRQFESSWNGDGQLQKIYSSARYLCVSLRSQGRTRYIYLGRGKGHEGLWEGEKQIPSQLRKKDQMLEYMRKHLSGRAFLGLEMDPVDRVIWLHYQSYSQKCSFGLFYNGRNLYFANLGTNGKNEEISLFKSWEKGLHGPENIEEIFKEVGKKPQNTTLISSNKKSIDDLLMEELREGVSKTGKEKRERKFLNRKRKNIASDLEKAKRWKALTDWLVTQSDLSLSEKKIQIEGVKINFQERSHFKRRDEVYEKIKKLKRGEAILRSRLEDVKSVDDEDPKAEEKSSLDVIRPVWPNKKKNTLVGPQTQTTDKGYKIFKYEDFELGVGESAQGNDQLRKSWAKKEDLWIHLDQITSPHIVLKPSTRVLDDVVLREVGALMRKYTQSGATELNLIYTQVKNLKGISGKAGAVNFKKEKRIRIFLD